VVAVADQELESMVIVALAEDVTALTLTVISVEQFESTTVRVSPS
jgi:hypothetical protein